VPSSQGKVVLERVVLEREEYIKKELYGALRKKRIVLGKSYYLEIGEVVIVREIVLNN
ncbi:7242_t:CDS:1, partial [Gigaspora margarita]